MALAINVYIIFHLTLVMFLHYLILNKKKTKTYVVFVPIVRVHALKRTGFGV